MTREEMKSLANAFCTNSCSEKEMYECNCFDTSCVQLANYLVDIHNNELKENERRTL